MHTQNAVDPLTLWNAQDGTDPLPLWHAQDGMYDVLFSLSDLPGCPEIREQAVQVLQLLPTCPSIPERLRSALLQDSSVQRLILDPDQPVKPARLLYFLQASLPGSWLLLQSD